MEQQLNDLQIAHESLKRKCNAIEKALLNIKGFYVETADGSEQGLVKYGVPPTQVEPVPVVPEEPVAEEPPATEGTTV